MPRFQDHTGVDGSRSNSALLASTASAMQHSAGGETRMNAVEIPVPAAHEGGAGGGIQKENGHAGQH